MGQTSECIHRGHEDGREGRPMPEMLGRLGDYILPYLDGYRVGFCERKAREHRPWIGGAEHLDSWAREYEALMTRPRVTVKRHPERWSRLHPDGTLETHEPGEDFTRMISPSGHSRRGFYRSY